jgi:hypothetical protein
VTLVLIPIPFLMAKPKRGGSTPVGH